MSGRGRGGRRICRGEEAHRERRRTAPTSSIVKKVKPCPAMPAVQREPKQHMVVRVQNLGHYRSWQLWPDLITFKDYYLAYLQIHCITVYQPAAHIGTVNVNSGKKKKKKKKTTGAKSSRPPMYGIT